MKKPISRRGFVKKKRYRTGCSCDIRLSASRQSRWCSKTGDERRKLEYPDRIFFALRQYTLYGRADT